MHGGFTMADTRIKVVFGNERIIPATGLGVVGGILGRSNFRKRADRKPVNPKRSQPQIKNGDIFLTFIGLTAMGKPQYEAVKEFDDDPDFFKDALGIVREFPSPETLRQRMDEIGDSARSDLLQANIEMFTANEIKPSALPGGLVPVDMDVTPFDNSKTMKEGVSRTYKGFDGYAPMMAYIGTEGFMVNTELREGKQHSQAHTPEFLKETLSMAHQLTDAQLLIRLDSGNDAAENYGILIEDGSWFIVKRNPRKESKEAWLNELRGCCKDIRYPREGKVVYVGSTWKKVNYKTETGEAKSIDMRIVYEITERTIDKHGQILMIPDIELNMFWTNLGWSDDDIIASYHAHGECEQYHSELKTDMDVERLPSGKFATNALVLELAMIAFNILRMIGQESLRHKQPDKRKVRRRRLRTVISNLMFCASHVTRHARKVIIALGRSNTWRQAFQGVWNRFVYA